MFIFFSNLSFFVLYVKCVIVHHTFSVLISTSPIALFFLQESASESWLLFRGPGYIHKYIHIYDTLVSKVCSAPPSKKKHIVIQKNIPYHVVSAVPYWLFPLGYFLRAGPWPGLGLCHVHGQSIGNQLGNPHEGTNSQTI